MPALQILQFIDCFELIGSLRTRINLFKDTDDEGARVLPMRWPDAEDTEAPVWKYPAAAWKAWPELRNTVSRIQKLGEQFVGPVERGRTFFEMLDPATALPWRAESGVYWASGFMRLHLPLRTNPLAIIYAGGEALSPGIGALTLANTAVRHCAVNFGQHQRIHLVLDLRKKAPEEAVS